MAGQQSVLAKHIRKASYRGNRTVARIDFRLPHDPDGLHHSREVVLIEDDAEFDPEPAWRPVDFTLHRTDFEGWMHTDDYDWILQTFPPSQLTVHAPATERPLPDPNANPNVFVEVNGHAAVESELGIVASAYDCFRCGKRVAVLGEFEDSECTSA